MLSRTLRDGRAIEWDEKSEDVFRLIQDSDRSLFVTGRAGTGKSTLLTYCRYHIRKNIAVLAPTGVAALNIHGQTIHSFFRFKPDITPDKVADLRIRKGQRELYFNLDTIMIDEVSMVRADLLDSVDAFMRRFGRNPDRPFGGVQMVFSGDLFQLPPVVQRGEERIFQEMYDSPYFFDARAFRRLDAEYIELDTIYRQKEERFIELLNAFRINRIKPEYFERLNQRYLPSFIPSPDKFFIYLTTTNARADHINQWQLNQLSGRMEHYDGSMEGKFEQKNLPTHLCLTLKIGAQVMLLNNDPEGEWINGSVGKVRFIERCSEGDDLITVELSDGRMVDVTMFTWEMFKFTFNHDTGQLESERTGSFKQYPLRLAWAVTIHKSQGKTFDHVIIDIGHGAFSHGQVYVALSRCTTLEGIVLKKPIRPQHVLMDRRITDFMARTFYRDSVTSVPDPQEHIRQQGGRGGQMEQDRLFEGR